MATTESKVESPERRQAAIEPPRSASALSSLAALSDRKRKKVSPVKKGARMASQSKRLRHPRPASSPPSLPALPAQSCPVRDCPAEWGFYTEQLTPANASLDVAASRPQPRNCFIPGQFECDSDACGQGMGNITDDELVDAITTILENICSINNGRIVSSPGVSGTRAPYRSAAFPDGSSSIYFSLQKPAVEMRYYVARLVKYMHVSASVFIVALIYLDRVHSADEILALQDLNVHRLITTSLAVSCKFLEDEVHRNSTICRIGGVPSTVEMNLLESQFLRRINWNCAVSAEQYELYRSNVFKSRRPGHTSICPSSCSESQTEMEDGNGSSESPRGVAARVE